MLVCIRLYYIYYYKLSYIHSFLSSCIPHLTYPSLGKNLSITHFHHALEDMNSSSGMACCSGGSRCLLIPVVTHLCPHRPEPHVPVRAAARGLGAVPLVPRGWNAGGQPGGRLLCVLLPRAAGGSLALLGGTDGECGAAGNLLMPWSPSSHHGCIPLWKMPQ